MSTPGCQCVKQAQQLIIRHLLRNTFDVHARAKQVLQTPNGQARVVCISDE